MKNMRIRLIASAALLLASHAVAQPQNGQAGSRVAGICISFRGNPTQLAKACSISSSVWPFVSGRRQRMNRKPAKQMPA